MENGDGCDICGLKYSAANSSSHLNGKKHKKKVAQIMENAHAFIHGLLCQEGAKTFAQIKGCYFATFGKYMNIGEASINGIPTIGKVYGLYCLKEQECVLCGEHKNMREFSANQLCTKGVLVKCRKCTQHLQKASKRTDAVRGSNAQDEIQRTVDQKQHKENRYVRGNIISEEETMAVPSACAGYVIGKGGDNLKLLTVKTGARVRVSREAVGDFRHVTIRGDRQSIEYAKQEIQKIVDTTQAHLLKMQRQVVVPKRQPEPQHKTQSIMQPQPHLRSPKSQGEVQSQVQIPRVNREPHPNPQINLQSEHKPNKDVSHPNPLQLESQPQPNPKAQPNPKPQPNHKRQYKVQPKSNTKQERLQALQKTEEMITKYKDDGIEGGLERLKSDRTRLAQELWRTTDDGNGDDIDFQPGSVVTEESNIELDNKVANLQKLLQEAEQQKLETEKKHEKLQKQMQYLAKDSENFIIMWQWEKSKDEWIRYGEDHQQEFNVRFHVDSKAQFDISFYTTCFVFSVRNATYKIDFQTMSQVSSAGTRRNIRRRKIDVGLQTRAIELDQKMALLEDRAKKAEQQKAHAERQKSEAERQKSKAEQKAKNVALQKSHVEQEHKKLLGELGPVDWQWSCNDSQSQWMSYDAQMQKILEGYKAEKSPIRCSFGFNKFTYDIDFVAMTQTNTGTKTVRKIRRHRSGIAADIDKELRVLLKKWDVETADSVKRFVAKAHVGHQSCVVSSVLRVLRNDIPYHPPRDPRNEMVLFHATSAEAALTIQNGSFIPSNGGLLGAGVYFAPSPQKAWNYRKGNVDTILLCLVNIEGAKVRGHGAAKEYCVDSARKTRPLYILVF